jgi:tetratricopeptide (TPR) repeat protein
MLNKIDIRTRKQILIQIIYILLTVSTLAVFWQVNQYDFIYLDDQIYITDNRHIQSGITSDGFRWAFSTIDADTLWHPLVWLSFMLDYQLIGLNAGGYHITNLLLHIMSTLLLFWLFYRMTGAIWKSAFVAAFFALHPLHVESVAWIAERKDVLSAFFWMLTLCLYVYYTEKPVIKRYLLVLLGFVCALMSKPMVVTLPVIMILLDYWPLKRFQLKETGNNLKEVTPGKGPLWLFWEKIPFFILSAVFSIITICTQYNPSIKYFSLGSRLANAPVSFVTYLEKTFWPHDLAAFYPFSFQLPSWQVLGAVLLIIVISAAVIVSVKRLPYLFVGWLWYAIILLPVIGIIQSGEQAMADRYHYLPSIGIAVMLAWGIPHLFSREDIRTKILFPMGVVFIAILSFITWHQCGYWKNNTTLFSHALQITNNNALAHNLLASSLAEENKINEVIYHCNAAIRLSPYYADAYNNRGNAYAKLGQNQRSIEDYNKAIALKSGYADAYNNRGGAYFKLGQYQLAVENFNEALFLKPDYADAYNNRGGAYFKLGQYQLAIENFNDAILLKPDYADAYNNLAIVYFQQGYKELGCFDARKACALGVCKILEAVKVKGYCR